MPRLLMLSLCLLLTSCKTTSNHLQTDAKPSKFQFDLTFDPFGELKEPEAIIKSTSDYYPNIKQFLNDND